MLLTAAVPLNTVLAPAQLQPLTLNPLCFKLRKNILTFPALVSSNKNVLCDMSLFKYRDHWRADTNDNACRSLCKCCDGTQPIMLDRRTGSEKGLRETRYFLATGLLIVGSLSGFLRVYAPLRDSESGSDGCILETDAGAPCLQIEIVDCKQGCIQFAALFPELLVFYKLFVATPRLGATLQPMHSHNLHSSSCSMVVVALNTGKTGDTLYVPYGFACKGHHTD